MAKQDNRFIITYSRNSFSTGARILTDRRTGVNYRFFQEGTAGGLTPLPDQDGKPVATAVYDED